MENTLKINAEQVLIAWHQNDTHKRKQLLEYLGVPAIISDLSGLVLDYNIQAQLLLGLSRDEFLGENLDLILRSHLLVDKPATLLDNVYQFKGDGSKPDLFFINTYENENHKIYFLVRTDGFNKPEDALLVTEQKYRNSVQNAVEGIFILGLKGFHLVNKSFCTIFGYDMEEIMRIDPYLLVPPNYRQPIKANLNRKLTERILMHRKVEQVLLHRSGYEVICEMSFFSTIYNGEYAIQGHVRDISELKRIEKELEESEVIYRTVVENAYDNVFIIDNTGIVYANKRLYETINYNYGELIGNSDFEWIAPEFRKRFIKMTENINSTKPSAYFQCDLMTREGVRKNFVFNVSTILFKNKYAYLAIGKDISFQKQQIREKRIEKRRDAIVNRILRIVAESKGSEDAFIGVIKVLGMEFPKRGMELCIYESDNLLKVYSIVENVPKTMVVVKDDNEDYLTYLQNKRMEFRSICKVSSEKKDERFCASGFKYLMQLTLTGLNKPFGVFRCAWKEEDASLDNRLLTEIILEIAIALESVLYREKIARITREAVQEEKNKLLSKFSLIGEMSTTIAHEVRNPMTTVRGLAQLLKEEYPAKEPYFDLMIDEIDRANTTITEFLNLAQNRFTRKEKLNLYPLLGIVVDLMQAEAVARGINIISEFSVKDAMVYIDNEQVKQAFMNILQNALEASEIGDTICIKVFEDFEKVFIKFTDEGSGVDSKHLNHIMEPFFTTKENNAGLGLSVSYKIIRDHGGEMCISSVINKGTTVKVSLPKYTNDRKDYFVKEI